MTLPASVTPPRLWCPTPPGRLLLLGGGGSGSLETGWWGGRIDFDLVAGNKATRHRGHDHEGNDRAQVTGQSRLSDPGH